MIALPKPIVSAEWLAANIDEPNLVILNATIPKVQTQGLVASPPDSQIKNARFFDLKGAFKDKDTDLPNMLPSPDNFAAEARKLGINKDSSIVVYDEHGIYSSPRVWWMFKIMGHEEVAVLDGGYISWMNAGLPIETKKYYYDNGGNFQSIFQPDMIVDTQQVLSNIDLEEMIVFDARSKGRFEGSAPEPRAGLRGGHIPKSKSLPHTRVVEKPCFLSKDLLKAAFPDEVGGYKKVIFTCGSGLTACITALAADIVGLKNVAIYDGSWTEWAGNLDLPVVNDHLDEAEV